MYAYPSRVPRLLIKSLVHMFARVLIKIYKLNVLRQVTYGKYWALVKMSQRFGRRFEHLTMAGHCRSLCKAPVLTKHTVAILVLLQQSNNDCFKN